MILVLKKGVSLEEKENVKQVLAADGCIIREIVGEEETVVGLVGKIKRDVLYYEQIPGVEKAIPITKPYKLASREILLDATNKGTIVRIGDVEVGGDRLLVIAGPCAIESREQAFAIAHKVRQCGALLFRGGAFKPRTSPYAFQGLEEKGLKILAQVREETGLRVVTEMTSPSQADLMLKYVDVVQVGARNMQNFELLKTVGRMNIPVLLKRGLAATIEEWLMAAEYILSENNNNVILCERGIRTFETITRNTLDLSAIPVVKKLTHLPIIIDPSHATGLRDKVLPMSRAAVAAGADGLIIEVHNDPEHALSDGPQSLYPEQFEQLMRDIYVIAPVVGKQIDFAYLDKNKRFDGRVDRLGHINGKTNVALHGEDGNFSFRACRQFFGKTDAIVPMSCHSFEDVFDAVSAGEAEFGLIPLENSLTGSMHENYDHLLDYDVTIIGELLLRIEYGLVVRPGTTIDEIKEVFSHPQALQQCRLFLSQHPSWELIPVNDTSAGVKRLAENPNRSSAAIAGKEAADIYKMEVLKEGIETNPRNFTRFIVISKERKAQDLKTKSTLVYATGNVPGALFNTLKVFYDHGVNLVKLESCPIHGKPWEYMFYVDVEGDVYSKAFQPILDQLRAHTEFLKVLGSY
ncbi:MAG: 3-deoxy-7-phosphoheptulonate synthase [Pseudomonadota bacterium]